MPCQESHTTRIRPKGTGEADLGQESNPNPMNSRCGLEDCDCEYTIGGLLRRLELIAEQAKLTVEQTRKDPAPARCTRPIHPCPDCYDLGYQDGYEAGRRPIGA